MKFIKAGLYIYLNADTVAKVFFTKYVQLCMCIDIVITECRSESQLNSKRFVDTVTLNNSPINTDDLFNFVKTERYYCGPTNMRPFTLTITYSSSVLLREIGIHGRDRTFPLSNQYVNSFSLSFSEDGDNFTEYIRDTGSTVCHINVCMYHGLLH